MNDDIFDDPEIIIPNGWESFFLSNRELINRILDILISSDKTIRNPATTFDAFYNTHPDTIRAVIVSDEPIPIKRVDIFACKIAWTGNHVRLWEEFTRNLIRWLSHRHISAAGKNVPGAAEERGKLDPSAPSRGTGLPRIFFVFVGSLWNGGASSARVSREASTLSEEVYNKDAILSMSELKRKILDF